MTVVKHQLNFLLRLLPTRRINLVNSI